jgi:5-methylcytosine-specific restriction endonuclease McrBC GTP-binding regulatory subunit McrB
MKMKISKKKNKILIKILKALKSTQLNLRMSKVDYLIKLRTTMEKYGKVIELMMLTKCK